MSSYVRKFLQAVLPGIIKPLHALWNEIIGFVFLVLAAVMVRPVWHAWQRAANEGVDVKTVLDLTGGVLLLGFGLGFGIHGFVKARRISRS
jgi:hypothetical protein